MTNLIPCYLLHFIIERVVTYLMIDFGMAQPYCSSSIYRRGFYFYTVIVVFVVVCIEFHKPQLVHVCNMNITSIEYSFEYFFFVWWYELRTLCSVYFNGLLLVSNKYLIYRSIYEYYGTIEIISAFFHFVSIVAVCLLSGRGFNWKIYILFPVLKLFFWVFGELLKLSRRTC